MLKALRTKLHTNVHENLEHEDVLMNKLNEQLQKKKTLELKIDESTLKVTTVEGDYPNSAMD